MIRLHAVVEGQTEETFVNQVLAPHLAARNIYIDAHRVTTGRKRGRKYRGGISSYDQLQRDLRLWSRQDKGPDSRFTTMVDLYRLPDDFPGYDECRQSPDPHAHVQCLEDRLANDVQDNRFVPYIQLHEFEALLFSEVAGFEAAFPDIPAQIHKLKAVRDAFATPEHIDETPDQSPAKRILREIPQYEKTVSGILIVQRIGLPVIRRECPHFAGWLQRLEALTS